FFFRGNKMLNQYRIEILRRPFFDEIEGHYADKPSPSPLRPGPSLLAIPSGTPIHHMTIESEEKTIKARKLDEASKKIRRRGGPVTEKEAKKEGLEGAIASVNIQRMFALDVAGRWYNLFDGAWHPVSNCVPYYPYITPILSL
ncbi:MAG: hypothetical protein AABW87_02865, partial [Nanoarchaeota archaeon]